MCLFFPEENFMCALDHATFYCYTNMKIGKSHVLVNTTQCSLLEGGGKNIAELKQYNMMKF